MNGWIRTVGASCLVSLGLSLACGGHAEQVGQGSSGGECSDGAGTGCASTEPEPAPVCAQPAAPLPGPPCSAGYFYYTDQLGGPGPNGQPGPSYEAGDQLCHQTCMTDRDCSDPCFPRCHAVGLFVGGDSKCNSSVRLCGTRMSDEC